MTEAHGSASPFHSYVFLSSHLTLCWSFHLLSSLCICLFFSLSVFLASFLIPLSFSHCLIFSCSPSFFSDNPFLCLYLYLSLSDCFSFLELFLASSPLPLLFPLSFSFSLSFIFLQDYFPISFPLRMKQPDFETLRLIYDNELWSDILLCCASFKKQSLLK